MSFYCNTKDLQDLTGSALSTDVLLAICEDASREVDAYLVAKGTSGSDGDQCKTASLKFARATLLDRMRFDGTKGTSRSIAGYSIGDDLEGQIQRLRKEAFVTLDRYVATKPGNFCGVRRVQGR